MFFNKVLVLDFLEFDTVKVVVADFGRLYKKMIDGFNWQNIIDPKRFASCLTKTALCISINGIDIGFSFSQFVILMVRNDRQLTLLSQNGL